MSGIQKIVAGGRGGQLEILRGLYRHRADPLDPFGRILNTIELEEGEKTRIPQTEESLMSGLDDHRDRHKPYLMRPPGKGKGAILWKVAWASLPEIQPYPLNSRSGAGFEIALAGDPADLDDHTKFIITRNAPSLFIPLDL